MNLNEINSLKEQINLITKNNKKLFAEINQNNSKIFKKQNSFR